MCVSGDPTLAILGVQKTRPSTFFYDLWRKNQIPEFEPNLGGDILFNTNQKQTQWILVNTFFILSRLNNVISGIT